MVKQILKGLICKNKHGLNMNKITTTFGQPTDKRDLTAKSENFQVMHILKILSIQSFLKISRIYHKAK